MTKRIAVASIVVWMVGIAIGYAEQIGGGRVTVSVQPIRNVTGIDVLDRLADTVQGSALLTLRLMGLYKIVEPPVPAADFSDGALQKYSEEQGIDSIVFGTLALEEGGQIAIKLSLYNRLDRAVTLVQEERAETIMDSFEAIDRALPRLIERFSGIHVAYGNISLQGRNLGGDLLVTLDDTPLGQRAGAYDRILTGDHRVKVEQNRIDGPRVLDERTVRVEEGGTTIVAVDLPLLFPEESRILDSLESEIRDALWRGDFPYSAYERLTGLSNMALPEQLHDHLSGKHSILDALASAAGNPKGGGLSSGLLWTETGHITRLPVGEGSSYVNSPQPLPASFMEGFRSAVETEKRASSIPLVPFVPIQIDGSIKDWEGKGLMINDPAGDLMQTGNAANNYAGMDIQRVRLARDANNLYVAIETTDARYPPTIHYRMWLNDLPGKNGNFLDVGVSTMPQDSGFIDRSQTRLPESPSFAFGQVLEISVPLRILPSKKNLWIRCFPKLMNINNSDLDRCEATVRLETIRSAISDGGE